MSRYDDDAPSGGALPWFLFGLGLGATLGLLLAPQSGSETRRALATKARKIKHLAEDTLEEVMDTAGRKGRKIREAIAESATDLGDDDEDDDAGPRPSRAREELERRLAAARARRRGPAAAPVGADEDDEESRA